MKNRTNLAFLQKISQVWSDPRAVAKIAFLELFSWEYEIFLPPENQADYAMEIGILASTLRTPEQFIEAFEAKVLNA